MTQVSDHDAMRSMLAGNAAIVEEAIKPGSPGSAAELHYHYEDVIAGRVENIPFAGAVRLSKLTQALIPGSVVSVCGDPGLGKTFWVLQNLQFWAAAKLPCACMFIEKTRLFHSARLLAQLEGSSLFLDLDEIPKRADEVRAAQARHATTIENLGRLIHSINHERYALRDVAKWMQERADEGARVLVIDPISVVDCGVRPWDSQPAFMNWSEKLAAEKKLSVILITHPRGGSGKPGMHSAAGSMAFPRMADCLLWFRKFPTAKRMKIRTEVGQITQDVRYVVEIHKARDGKGGGMEIALRFGDGFKFSEQGVVVGDDEEAQSPEVSSEFT